MDSVTLDFAVSFLSCIVNQFYHMGNQSLPVSIYTIKCSLYFWFQQCKKHILLSSSCSIWPGLIPQCLLLFFKSTYTFKKHWKKTTYSYIFIDFFLSLLNIDFNRNFKFWKKGLHISEFPYYFVSWFGFGQ